MTRQTSELRRQTRELKENVIVKQRKWNNMKHKKKQRTKSVWRHMTHRTRELKRQTQELKDTYNNEIKKRKQHERKKSISLVSFTITEGPAMKTKTTNAYTGKERDKEKETKKIKKIN